MWAGLVENMQLLDFFREFTIIFDCFDRRLSRGKIENSLLLRKTQKFGLVSLVSHGLSFWWALTESASVIMPRRPCRKE